MKKPKQDDPEQSRRFIEAARDAGGTDDAEAFEAMFRKVAQKTKTPEKK